MHLGRNEKTFLKNPEQLQYFNYSTMLIKKIKKQILYIEFKLHFSF